MKATESTEGISNSMINSYLNQVTNTLSRTGPYKIKKFHKK